MDVIMPQLGETVSEGTVAAWFKQVGDPVQAEEMLLEIETDKVTTEIPAPATGTLSQILVPEGETVEVGARLAVISVKGEAEESPVVESEAPPSAPAPQASAQPSPQATGSAAAPSARRDVERSRDTAGQQLSPVVRKLLGEHGLVPGAIPGMGPEGA